MNAKTHKDDLERIRKLRLIDDDFMSVCFDNYIEGAQLLIRIILGRDDIVVTDVRSQRMMKNLNGKGLQLDILAVDREGDHYNFEIQRSNEGADRRRARYHSSMLDSHMLDSGCKVTDLRENYVIFITENDVLGGKIPLYRIERTIVETDELFNDGEHIIYVNGTDRDSSTELGNLMHDLYCSDPKDIVHKELADRVRYYKEDEGGVETMCQLLDEMRNEAEERGRSAGKREGKREARIQNANRMIADGVELNKVAEYSGLSLNKVRELAGIKTA